MSKPLEYCMILLRPKPYLVYSFGSNQWNESCNDIKAEYREPLHVFLVVCICQLLKPNCSCIDILLFLKQYFGRILYDATHQKVLMLFLFCFSISKYIKLQHKANQRYDGRLHIEITPFHLCTQQIIMNTYNH